MEPTVKVILSGPPDRVEAVAGRLRQLFTVTYESKDRPSRLGQDSISRFLRVLPPDQAHRSTDQPTDQPANQPNKKSRP